MVFLFRMPHTHETKKMMAQKFEITINVHSGVHRVWCIYSKYILPVSIAAKWIYRPYMTLSLKSTKKIMLNQKTKMQKSNWMWNELRSFPLCSLCVCFVHEILWSKCDIHATIRAAGIHSQSHRTEPTCFNFIHFDHVSVCFVNDRIFFLIADVMQSVCVFGRFDQLMLKPSEWTK